jgi:hypothetical protein
MKHTLLIVLLLSSFRFVSGQPQKNDWMVGSNIVSSTVLLDNGGGYIQHGISLSPQGGCFLTNRLVLGVSVHYNYYHSSNSGGYDVGAAIFSRYYFKSKTNSKLFLNGDLGFGYSAITKTPYSVSSTESHSRNYGLGIGYTYFISSYVGLEVSLMVERIRYKYPITAFYVPSFGWGFQVYLPTGKPKNKLK